MGHGTDLNARRIDVHDSDPGADVAGDPELHPVVDGGVADEIHGVELEHVDAVDASTSLDSPATVRRLVEGRHGGNPQRHPFIHDEEVGRRVLDPYLVRVYGGEEHGDVEGEIGWGHDQVLDADLLQIELGLLGLDGEEDDKDDGDEEEGEEGEEEEEAAAAALEGCGGGGAVVVAVVVVVVGWVRRRIVLSSVHVSTGRHFSSFFFFDFLSWVWVWDLDLDLDLGGSAFEEGGAVGRVFVRGGEWSGGGMSFFLLFCGEWGTLG